VIFLAVLSWLSVAGVLGAYASDNVRLYAWANVVLCVPVALPALLLGAYSSGAISLAFGVIAGVLLWRRHRIEKLRRVDG
jgi:hypothetical protein